MTITRRMTTCRIRYFVPLYGSAEIEMQLSHKKSKKGTHTHDDNDKEKTENDIKRNAKWRCGNFLSSPDCLPCATATRRTLSVSQTVTAPSRSPFLFFLPSVALNYTLLTFRQQSILNDARLEQQPRQQQTQRNEDVHKRCCRSAVCPQCAQRAPACLLLKAIVGCQSAASLLGASCQLDAVVCQVSHLSSIQM